MLSLRSDDIKSFKSYPFFYRALKVIVNRLGRGSVSAEVIFWS